MPFPAQVERVDRPGGFDRLGRQPVEHRPLGPLPEITAACAPEIPPGRGPGERHRGQQCEGPERRNPEHRADRQHDRHRRNEDRRQSESRCPGERFDVIRRSGNQVSGPRSLQSRERESARPVDEPLAQIGEQALTEDETRPPRPPRQPGLHQHRDQQQPDMPIDMPARRAGNQRIDQATDEQRQHERGHRGQRVQDEHRREFAPVVTQHVLGVPPDHRRLGHRKCAPMRIQLGRSRARVPLRAEEATRPSLRHWLRVHSGVGQQVGHRSSPPRITMSR